MERVADYDRTLRALGMEDDELDRAPKPGRLLRAALLVGQVAAVYQVMPWLLVLGGVINLGPMVVIKIGTILAAPKDKDVATLMVAGGAVLYPLTWLASALLGAWLSAQLHEWYPVIPSVP